MLRLFLLAYTMTAICTSGYSQQYAVAAIGIAHGFSNPHFGSDLDDIQNSGAPTMSISAGLGKQFKSGYYMQSEVSYSTWASQLHINNTIDSQLSNVTNTFATIGVSMVTGYTFGTETKRIQPFASLGVEPQYVFVLNEQLLRSAGYEQINISAQIQLGLNYKITHDLFLITYLNSRSQLLDGLPDGVYREHRHNVGVSTGLRMTL